VHIPPFYNPLQTGSSNAAEADVGTTLSTPRCAIVRARSDLLGQSVHLHDLAIADPDCLVPHEQLTDDPQEHDRRVSDKQSRALGLAMQEFRSGIIEVFEITQSPDMARTCPNRRDGPGASSLEAHRLCYGVIRAAVFIQAQS
jgi:hypothetical protein